MNQSYTETHLYCVIWKIFLILVEIGFSTGQKLFQNIKEQTLELPLNWFSVENLIIIMFKIQALAFIFTEPKKQRKAVDVEPDSPNMTRVYSCSFQSWLWDHGLIPLLQPHLGFEKLLFDCPPAAGCCQSSGICRRSCCCGVHGSSGWQGHRADIDSIRVTWLGWSTRRDPVTLA